MNSAEDQVDDSNINETDKANTQNDEKLSKENVGDKSKQDEGSDEKEATVDYEIKCKDLEDQILRLRAEQENFRRAQFKETEKKVNIAVKNVVTKFLTVIGHFDIGIKSAEQATNVDGVLQGMKMVDLSFKSILSEIGVEEVSTDIGQPFDANFHQPLTKVESDEHPENSILSVISKGYTLKGMLVQPSMVTVSCEPKVVDVEVTEENASENSEEPNQSQSESDTTE